MNQSVSSSSNSRPSAIGAFFRGFGSGALSGALMMGLVFAVGFGLASIPALAASSTIAGSVSAVTLGSTAFMSLVTGLFGGIMSAKSAMFSEPETTSEYRRTSTVIPVLSPSHAITPTVVPDAIQQPASTKQWTSDVARSDTQATIQKILDTSSSDKSRASALLAARESAANTPTAGLGA